MTDGGIPCGYEPIVSSAAFGALSGPYYERQTPDGGWTRGFLAEERHGNPGGIVHGGMLATFADIICARAILHTVPRPFVTIRLQLDYAGYARIGTFVEGRAHLTGSHGPGHFITGRIWEGEKTVASISAVFHSLNAS